MQNQIVPLVRALASLSEQQRYIINASADEYLLPEELLNNALEFCFRARTDNWLHLTQSQKDAVRALENAAASVDLEPYDRANIEQLIEQDPFWAAARRSARHVLQAFGLKTIDLPSRDDVLAVFKRLISGDLSPEAASAWATPFYTAVDAEVVDWGVWRALEVLVMADADGGDRQYLYGPADFQAWEEELLASEPLGNSG